MKDDFLKRIILVGNPNVGKSVIFYRLTGQYATVSNYPGTTIEIARSKTTLGKDTFEVIDTPGVNSLWPQSEDEKVTLSIIKNNPDSIIVQVADAKNLTRALPLTFQLLELKMPLILILNLYDEAITAGLKIDVDDLGKSLGIPVIATVAITGDGIPELKHAISSGAPTKEATVIKAVYPREITDARNRLKKYGLPEGFDLLLLGSDEADPEIFGRNKEMAAEITRIKERFVRPPSSVIFETYYKHSVEIANFAVTSQQKTGSEALERFGRIIMRPFWGYVFAFFILYLMYQFVGVFAAGTLVDFFEEVLFGKFINPGITAVFDALRISGFFRELFVGEYGLVTMALTYAIAIIFPIVGAFFIFFGILEDSGYLPRLAAMLDRFFKVIGLNGKAVLPMILGLGCGTMATLTARILETRRERIIATLLLSLSIPCSAQLGVILGILSSQGMRAFAIWFVTILLVFTLIGYLSSKILPGSSSQFIIEIPPLRLPMTSNILLKVKQRILWYLKEAVPLFVIGTLALFALDKIRALEVILNLASPVVNGALDLPPKTAEAFLTGFLRRDYGAAGLFDMIKDELLNKKQIVVSIVTITLFVPCLAQFLVMIKERGGKTAFAIFTFVIVFSFVVGGILNGILTWVKY